MLIAEDEVSTRFLLCDVLAPYGVCHGAADGQEAVDAVRSALDRGEPYDLVCLDIKMPKKDGQEALKEIRELEKEHGVLLGHGAKIIMCTSVSDSRAILDAFGEACEGYLIKPVTPEKLIKQIRELGLPLEESSQ
jgi:two-component system chemotaxis response regulator CheY